MLSALIRLSLQNRLLVLAFSILLLIYGGITMARLPVDVLPDLNRPTVSILTEAPGLAPEEVETLVTLPLETTLNGAPGVMRVRSSSGVGLSVLYAEFDWNIDIYKARQLVQERLQLAAGKLPRGVTPSMGPISSIMGEIMLISIASRTGQTLPMDIRSLADWTIRPRLLSIPGVSQAIAIGGGVKQYQVLASPEKMSAYAISFQELIDAVELAQGNTPGGYLQGQNQEILVRNIGRIHSLEDIANSVVAMRGGTPIVIKDVADVRFGKQVMRGDAGASGNQAVILSIQKQPGADTVTLTKEIEHTLNQISNDLPEDFELKQIFKQAVFIESAISNVEQALRDGAIIVAIVLIAFLLNARTTAISLTAIPLSIIISAIVFKLLGLSINTMTLGGLAIAIGEMVDDAIVDVENVFRRLKENRSLQNPRTALKVIFDASTEIRNSIIFATTIVVLVFIPLFALGGIEGRLFAPIGIAYITSIIASLFVAVTLTPVLCSYLLPNSKHEGAPQDSWLVKKLKQFDRDVVLRYSLQHPMKVICAALALVVGSFSLYPLMGKEFLPEFNEGTATINIFSAPGTSLEQSNRVGAIAEKLLLAVPEVVSTGRRTGRAEQDEHAEGLHYTEIDVDLKQSTRGREAILDEIRGKLGELPGVVISVGQPISHRLDHMLSGVRAQVAVKVFGPNLEKLRDLAAQVETTMKGIQGVVDLQVEKQVLIPQIQIEARRDKAMLYGIQVGQLNALLETALNGSVLGQILDGQRTYDLFVAYNEESRQNIEALKTMLIDVGNNQKVPLGLLANIYQGKGPNVVNRENALRRIVVQANTANRDLNSVVSEIQDRVTREVNLPQGYHIRFEGQFQSQREAARLIGALSIITLLAMFLVLYSHFRSGVIVLQILANIPLAFVGGLALTYIMIGTISIATLVGFITLAGIASRNTIMMISHYLHLMAFEGESFSEKMVVRGSLERLVPVTMTALTAGLALIPLAFSSGEPGKEILYPVAVVILGGLVSSTLLDMAVTPAVFWKFGKKAALKYRPSSNDI